MQCARPPSLRTQLLRNARLVFDLTLAGSFNGSDRSNLNAEVAILNAKGAVLEVWIDDTDLLQGTRTSQSLVGVVMRGHTYTHSAHHYIYT